MNENDSNKLPLPEKIGPYKVLRRLGLGGMGEVFLVHDPLCQRDVALKQIRSDLKHNKTLQNRFLREAHIAAGLTHPSIIPIYAIAEREESVYYTMPYVQGETLKQIIRAAFEQEKEGKILHPIGSSIPALMRIFLNVCQAIAYAHSRGVLHRDIKPENIIVGKYGEVLILDWGIAQRIGINDESEEMLLTPSGEENEITRPGKIPGTIAYMPPERAFGEAASVLTDIYSLGVLLYQLLTLRLPFQRTTLSSLRKQLKFEKLLDPAETAPYRDIPLQLANITKKALSPDKKLRIQSVKELIEDIESDIEGRPVWMFMAPLSIGRKSDWEFQENVLLAKHIAITRTTELMEWVNLMISKASFSGNTRLEAKMTLRKGGKGLGFLLSIPGSDERKGIEEGDCLWIGSDIALFRSNVEVIRAASCGPEIDKECLLTIEKVDNHLRIFLDGELKLRYLSHIPMRSAYSRRPLSLKRL
jgi:serine/threonine protein kinase